MELTVAISLIERGVLKTLQPQVWADLGAGKGLFSSALSTLLSDDSVVYAVDQDKKALSAIKLKAPRVVLKTIQGDFTRATELESLDGILMANSLHFVSDKVQLIKGLKSRLKPSGRMIIIEYDMKTANPWVPFPICFDDLHALAVDLELRCTKMGEHPSIYNRSNIYSAVLQQQEEQKG